MSRQHRHGRGRRRKKPNYSPKVDDNGNLVYTNTKKPKLSNRIK